MEGMVSYTQAAVERAMKVQEVILRAMAKKITWWQAAEIIGSSDRQMRRWHERYEEFGFRGLFDRRRGKPSPKKVPLAVVEKVLGLYREKYFDLNVRHFHEKLQEDHQVEISYSWVKGLLQGAGMVAKGRKRGVHRKVRERRPLPGMLLHIDGSEHRWFQDERWYDLIVILDDANSAIYHAQLVEEESTVTVMVALREVIEQKGLFCALYSDRGTHFWLTPKAGGKVDPHRLTQVGRALRELGVQMIPAYSPQARGRSHRDFATWRVHVVRCQLAAQQRVDRTLIIKPGQDRLGRYTAEGAALDSSKTAARPDVEKTRGGKAQKKTFPPRLESPQTARDSHFPTATTA